MIVFRSSRFGQLGAEPRALHNLIVWESIFTLHTRHSSPRYGARDPGFGRTTLVTVEVELIVFTQLLIATDGSNLAQKAVAHGLALAKALNAKVTTVTVTEPLSPVLSREPTSGLRVTHEFEAHEKYVPRGQRKPSKRQLSLPKRLELDARRCTSRINSPQKGSSGPRQHVAVI
jgi:hypothetical protein